jgi:hypothetical protein
VAPDAADRASSAAEPAQCEVLRLLSAEEGENSQDAAMRVGGRVDAEFEEDLGGVGFDGSFGHVDSLGDRSVGKAFGNECEHRRIIETGGSPVEVTADVHNGTLYISDNVDAQQSIARLRSGW